MKWATGLHNYELLVESHTNATIALGKDQISGEEQHDFLLGDSRLTKEFLALSRARQKKVIDSCRANLIGEGAYGNHYFRRIVQVGGWSLYVLKSIKSFAA